jgi:hypothetical protein
LCVNPDHLEIVTHKENQRRRAKTADATECTLTPVITSSRSGCEGTGAASLGAAPLVTSHTDCRCNCLASKGAGALFVKGSEHGHTAPRRD